ncbi:MAG: nicotinate-nucleotide diphosphorylase (carboxylating) [Candidatus Cloacimonas sp. 4484_209]|nr:MAG: nicotinate-nucleotide diphosphorylase (carboxylating) [Candidatus Cloacimonas sp. 4484_209]
MLKRETIREIVKRALAEDLGEGDITSIFTIPKNINALGIIVAKERGVLAGTMVAEQVFKVVDKNTKITFHKQDGERFITGNIIADIQGKAVSLLAAERVALNFLQRLCGIATLTRKYVLQVKGTGAKILDTRKTTPGIRILEKYAVRMGGGYNHRMGLYDQILIKDNHINLGGGIKNVLNKVKNIDSGKIFIEIEVRNIRQLKQALSYDIERIMLDNMSIEDIKKAVKIVNNKCELEVSGNVGLDNVRRIAKTGVDYISVGALTHSYRSIDLSMRIRKIG